MQLDSKKVRNDLMVDVEIAITRIMPWKLEEKYIKQAMERIKEIIIPAMEKDDYKIREQAREIDCNEDRIEELSSRVDELEADEEEREEEAEHLALVAMFYANTEKERSCK